MAQLLFTSLMADLRQDITEFLHLVGDLMKISLMEVHR